MLEMPILYTERLQIRPFVMEDLQDAHRLFDIELSEAELHAEKMPSLAERREWLQWSVLNPIQLAKLNQPPYGDRAIVLQESWQLIGSCGYVPCLNPFMQLPYFSGVGSLPEKRLYSTEFGLFYAVSPAHQRNGYAVEAARALVEYAFSQLHVNRVIAETDYENAASIGVMRKLGMRIEKNPLQEPPWLQVVGVLENEEV